MGSAALRHPADTLSFENETLWSYARDPRSGRQAHQRRSPAPGYTLRCFVMARAVKLFHHHCRFDPHAPPAAVGDLSRLLREVLARDPRRESGAAGRVIIPGFTDLRSFSAAHEHLLKAAAGGAWRSYFQRGHWRMVLPFSRRQQESEAGGLLASVHANRAPVVHVFTFPALTINHAMVLCAAESSSGRILFQAYDPNAPGRPVELSFERRPRVFSLSPTAYFPGGAVTVYEVYRNFWL